MVGRQNPFTLIDKNFGRHHETQTHPIPDRLSIHPALPGAGAPAFGAPVLKLQRKGCYSSWCETGWYSSPAVADLDGNGTAEVVGAAYSIFILDGATGNPKKSIDPPGDRVWPGVVVADLQGNGNLEIVTAHGDGYVHVFNQNGDLLWSRRPTPGNELRSLAVYDLDGDGDLEILVASTRSSDQWWVYEHDGSLRPGDWPQHGPDSDTNGYTAGCYNENVAAGDLDGDGRGEVFGPNDTHYLAMFEDDGQQVRANLMYGTNPDGSRKFWSRVGVHVDHAVDLRGYANCGIEHRPNFANSAPIIVDVNGDGTNEAVVVGNVYNCGTDPYTDLYEMPYIFNADRSRWKGGSYDWTAIPVPDVQAAPISEDYDVIENNASNPAAADLDGDGNLEILFPSYDGRMHAFWLDKTEHGNWPYAVYHPQEGFYRFASEPIVADLDHNGQAEVIFASWVQKGTGRTGRLHILNYLGHPIYEVDLPPAFGGEDWNGSLAAPTLANIDADPDLEVVLNTANSGLVAYDLPGTAGASILWGTGRGSYLRSGSLVQGTLQASEKRASRLWARPGDPLTYTLLLRNPGAVLGSVSLVDHLPGGVAYVGGSATSGMYGYANGIVSWSGAVRSGAPVTINFNVTVNPGITSPTQIANIAVIDDGAGTIVQRQAVTYVNGYFLFLPLTR